MLLLTLGIIPHPAEAATRKLLAFGDSLSAGYGLPADQGFVPKLQKALRAKGYDVEVINGGVSGDTSAGGVGRLDWTLADKPDAAIVELGANDALRGLDPAALADNLRKILDRFHQRGVPVLLAGMRAPSNWGPDYRRLFDAVYPALAQTEKVPLYPFFLDGVALDPKYTQPDGLHPNAAGVDVIVACILPSVEALLGPSNR